jgi:hypothetical protein
MGPHAAARGEDRFEFQVRVGRNEPVERRLIRDRRGRERDEADLALGHGSTSRRTQAIPATSGEDGFSGATGG